MIRPLIVAPLFALVVACGKDRVTEEFLPREYLESTTISIRLAPPEPVDPAELQQSSGLRGLTLSTFPVLAEPSGLGADGEPMEKYAVVSPDEMLRLIKLIENTPWPSGVQRSWSNLFAQPKTPPPTDSERHWPSPTESSTCRVTLTYTDGDYRWYVVMSHPWDNALGSFLRALHEEAPDKHIDELISTFERFR